MEPIQITGKQYREIMYAVQKQFNCKGTTCLIRADKTARWRLGDGIHLQHAITEDVAVVLCRVLNRVLGFTDAD